MHTIKGLNKGVLLHISNSTVKGEGGGGGGGGGRGGSDRKRGLLREIMATTAQVIWLCACLRCRPYCGDHKVSLTAETGVII